MTVESGFAGVSHTVSDIVSDNLSDLIMIPVIVKLETEQMCRDSREVKATGLPSTVEFTNLYMECPVPKTAVCLQ